VETRRTNNIAGAVSTITTSDLTASRALVSSGSGKVAISDITTTELGHLDGVSSGIQTQLDAKALESTRATNAAALAAGIASASSSDITVSNILHTTSTANSYATGGTTSDIDKVLVYLNGIYQNEDQYVLGNSTHNVQFKDATLASGLALEIRKF